MITACPKCWPNPHKLEDGRRVYCVIECDENGNNVRGSECLTPWEQLKDIKLTAEMGDKS